MCSACTVNHGFSQSDSIQGRMCTNNQQSSGRVSPLEWLVIYFSLKAKEKEDLTVAV